MGAGGKANTCPYSKGGGHLRFFRALTAIVRRDRLDSP
jgi:hypothetical protein